MRACVISVFSTERESNCAGQFHRATLIMGRQAGRQTGDPASPIPNNIWRLWKENAHYVWFSYHGGVIVSAHLTVSAPSQAQRVELQCLCVWGNTGRSVGLYIHPHSPGKHAVKWLYTSGLIQNTVFPTPCFFVLFSCLRTKAPQRFRLCHFTGRIISFDLVYW